MFSKFPPIFSSVLIAYTIISIISSSPTIDPSIFAIITFDSSISGLGLKPQSLWINIILFNLLDHDNLTITKANPEKAIDALIEIRNSISLTFSLPLGAFQEFLKHYPHSIASGHNLFEEPYIISETNFSKIIKPMLEFKTRTSNYIFLKEYSSNLKILTFHKIFDVEEKYILLDDVLIWENPDGKDIKGGNFFNGIDKVGFSSFIDLHQEDQFWFKTRPSDGFPESVQILYHPSGDLQDENINYLKEVWSHYIKVLSQGEELNTKNSGQNRTKGNLSALKAGLIITAVILLIVILGAYYLKDYLKKIMKKYHKSISLKGKV